MRTKTVLQSIEEIAQSLHQLSSSPRLDAEILLMHAFNWSRTQLFINYNDPLHLNNLDGLNRLIERRKNGEPIAYILGEQEFWSLPLRVTSDTLIPRPETEHLVESALNNITQDATWDILDLGTGTGAVALAIASERKKCRIVAVDLSSPALDVAAFNAKRLNINNVTFIQSSWLNELAGKLFHIIVSNPPYIEKNDEHLLQGDVAFEPRMALISGADGLDDIRQIISAAQKHLHPKGWLMLEHGWNQSEKVQNIMRNYQYQQISSINDLADIPRITIGQKA